MTKLTRDEIMALTPEQLRVEIAKAKGYEFSTYPSNVFDGATEYVIKDPDGYRSITTGGFESIMFIAEIPNYPVDIAAAWELVGQIIDIGCEMTLSSGEKHDERIWTVAIFKFRDDGIGTGFTISVCTDGDTLPLAISRAWLIWKMEAE